jgi:hypothetical protein
MEKVELPLIGQIDLSSLRSFYRTIISVNGMDVHVDLNFEKEKITSRNISKLVSFLTNIDRFHLQNLTYINHNFYLENSIVKDYIRYLIDDYGEDVYEALGLAKNSTDDGSVLLVKFCLIRIGVYIDDHEGSEDFAVFDYSINEITDYLIVLKTDEYGSINEICWES